VRRGRTLVIARGVADKGTGERPRIGYRKQRKVRS